MSKRTMPKFSERKRSHLPAGAAGIFRGMQRIRDAPPERQA